MARLQQVVARQDADHPARRRIDDRNAPHPRFDDQVGDLPDRRLGIGNRLRGVGDEVGERMVGGHVGDPPAERVGARRKAEQWWKARSPDPVPETAQHAVDLANNGALAHTERVTVRAVAGEKFERIIGCQLGPKPEPSPLWAVPDLDEVPF